MQYHSANYSMNINEFARMLLVSATSNAIELLIVSPGPIANLDIPFSRAFGSDAWKTLKRDRQVALPIGLTVYLEGSRTKSNFRKGNVYLPYASMHTVDEAVYDQRSVNTFFLPQSGPNSGMGQDDLTDYLKKYPSSINI